MSKIDTYVQKSNAASKLSRARLLHVYEQNCSLYTC